MIVQKYYLLMGEVKFPNSTAKDMIQKKDYIHAYFGTDRTVVLRGLQRRPELNGQSGQVVGYKYDGSAPELFRLVVKTSPEANHF